MVYDEPTILAESAIVMADCQRKPCGRFLYKKTVWSALIVVLSGNCGSSRSYRTFKNNYDSI